MAKRQTEPIKVVSYISLTPDGSKRMCTDDLNAEQRKYVGRKIALVFLNSIYAGEAVFQADLPSYESVFPESGDMFCGR